MRRHGIAAGLTGLLALLLPISGLAQDADPAAPQARLNVGQQIAVEDGNLIGITPLDLSLRTGTRVQTLEFTLSAPLRLNDPEEDRTFALGDPVARLLYRRGARNSAIEAQLGYRETDLDREILFDDIDDAFVIVDGGRVAQTDARLTYVFGREAKLGGEFGLSWLRRDYSGTTDPGLTDDETRRGNVTFFLEPTPQIRARILAQSSRTDGDDTDSRTNRYGAGASLQLDKLTNLDVELAQVNIRRSERDGTQKRSEGPSLRMNLTRSRPLGDITLSFSSEPGTSGRRENFNIGRSLEMRTYQLSGQIGATHFQGNYDPIFQIAYRQQVSRVAELQASLRRASVTNEDGDEALNTDISTNYTHRISNVSSIAAAIRYRESDIQAGDNQDARSVSFSLDFNRSLPNDFSLVAGASVIRNKDSGGQSKDDERIYVGVNRSFSLFP